eukprot:c19232_g2_i2.p1 GENE.c19232_g2_i2~~c19232_g2_i2.p1  ORF type:complete len:103 (+),score=23.03 c19232_g2_i2:183-491(+)
MKVDVEGNEIAVLTGARKMLEAKRIYHIIMEFNKPQWKRGNVPKSEIVNLVKWLHSLGYLMKPSNYGNFFTTNYFDVNKFDAMYDEPWSSFDIYFYLPEPRD